MTDSGRNFLEFATVHIHTVYDRIVIPGRFAMNSLRSTHTQYRFWRRPYEVPATPYTLRYMERSYRHMFRDMSGTVALTSEAEAEALKHKKHKKGNSRCHGLCSLHSYTCCTGVLKSRPKCFGLIMELSTRLCNDLRHATTR